MSNNFCEVPCGHVTFYSYLNQKDWPSLDDVPVFCPIPKGHVINPAQYGKIPLSNGSIFIWQRMNDGEVHGCIEKEHGGFLKGASGWWRTNDEYKAARLAEIMYCKNITKEKHK